MLLTAGGLGFWMLYDLVLIACSEFKDGDGRTIIFAKQGDSAPKKILGILAMLVGTLVVYIVIIFVIVFNFVGDISAPVQRQLAAIRAGDLDGAYSEYTSPEFRSITSIDTFKQFISQVSALKDNASASFPIRKFTNNQGILIGTVKGKDGNEQPIEYLLTYNKNTKAWEIAGINLSPDLGDADANASDGKVDKGDAIASAATSQMSGNMRYTDNGGNFSIEYPSDWYHEEPDKSTVMFSGRKGSPSYYSTVTIQMLTMKKAGGLYRSVDEIVTDLKNQIKEKTTDVKYISEGKVTLPKNSKYAGQYFEVTYTYKGRAMQKIQYVMQKPDGSVAYSWGYTTPADRYKIDFPIAAAMYKSWEIK